MSDTAPRDQRLSVDEYLRREARAQVRHEYVEGFVYAMTGATNRHTKIVRNIISALCAATAGGPCEVLFLDTKVRIGDERFYYPDVLVSCAPIDYDEVFVREPCLVVEVTSPSTRATDRREKLIGYGKVASLQTYLVVDHRRRFGEVYRRDEGGLRLRADVSGDGAIELPCPRTTLMLDTIYEGVTLPAIRERAPSYTASASASR